MVSFMIYKKCIIPLTLFSIFSINTSLAAKASFTPSMINNGVGITVYAADSFMLKDNGKEKQNTDEINNLMSYLTSSKMQNTNIIYLDGFDLTRGSDNVATIPDDPTMVASYKNLTNALHAAHKTVILLSSLPAYDANNQLYFGNTLTDLAKLVINTLKCDGIAFDYETSTADGSENTQYTNPLGIMATTLVADSKYFGIVTNTGKQETSIAPVFHHIYPGCKANPTATNYCFESIMRYDGGTSYRSNPEHNYYNDYTLWSELAYIGHLATVSLYSGNNNTSNQPIIRIMLPMSYSADSFPDNTPQPQPSQPSSPTNALPDTTAYTYKNYICDLTRVVNYLKFMTYNDYSTDCPNTISGYYTNENNIHLNFATQTSKLFAGASDSSNLNANTFVFGGFDAYRAVNARDAANTLSEPNDTALGNYHYICNSDSTHTYSAAFACTTGLSSQNQNRLPNTSDYSIFLKANAPLPLAITSHFVSDTEEAFVVTGGAPGDTCTITANPDSNGATPINITLNGSGALTQSLTMSDVSANIQANGEQDTVAVTCNNSGQASTTFTRYGDKAKICFTNTSTAQVMCVDTLFGETATNTPIQSPELNPGEYTVSIYPSKLNNTQEADSQGYYDNTLTPYTIPASTVNINGDIGLKIGFYRNSSAIHHKHHGV